MIEHERQGLLAAGGGRAMTATVIDGDPVLSGMLDDFTETLDRFEVQVREQEDLAEHYAEIIRTETTKSVESVIKIGRTLIEAKAKLGNTAWLAMVETDLGWKRSTAYALMKVAAHPVLSASNMLDKLPGSWSTLELLAKLDPAEIESGVKLGAIHPGVTRREASEVIGAKRYTRERAERREQSREAMARPTLPEPQPSPAAVLRGLAEETGEVFSALEVLLLRVATAIESGTFGAPRKRVKDYGVAEILDDLRLSLEEAREAIGGHYDDLAPRCGLPTREQA